MAKTKSKRAVKAAKPFADLSEALLALKPTREGFEGLITDLVEATTGGKLALMSSGDQAGVDSIGQRSSIAPRRAMQAKRYSDSTGLDQNHLLGEMDRANLKFGGIDCWILASTKSVLGKEREDLELHAERLGWGLVVLDWTLLGGLPKLAVLCAIHLSVTRRYVTGSSALKALTDISASAAFGDARRQIEHDLTAPDVGFEAARAAAAKQMERVFTDRFAARQIAGASPTYLCQVPPISRPSLDEAIKTWWSGQEPFASLLGEEGVGKTWAALGSLREFGAKAGGPLVVTIPSSMAQKAGDGLSAVVGVLSEAARHAGWTVADGQTFWRRRLMIWAGNRTDEPQPRLLVLVDGLDELDPFDWNSWLAPLVDDSLKDLVRIILACRQDDWRRGARPTDIEKDRLKEIPVGTFAPEERDAFFASQAIDVAKVSKPVLEAALHPRTAFHVVRLGAEIGDLTRITREQILLRDFSNRHELKGGTLTPETFELVVIQMARDAEAAVISQTPYSAMSGQVVDFAVRASGHEPGAMRRILSEMVSGGWVQRDELSPLKLTFTDKSLPLAVGMALAESIQSQPLDKAVAEVDRLLEPWGADDLIEPVLRTCATVLITRDAPAPLCRDILRRWAALRFHDRDAQDFWRRLHAFMPELFLEMVESGATGSSWLGEWGVASLWEDQPEHVTLVERTLHRWLTRIGLPRQPQRTNPGLTHAVENQRTRQLRRARALENHGGDGWTGLLCFEVEPRITPFHRAVRTIGLIPRAAFVPSLAGWALASAAAGHRYGLTEISALLRDNAFDWAETNEAVSQAIEALIALNTGLGRTAAALLSEATGRPEDAARAEVLRPRPAGRVQRTLLDLVDQEVVLSQNDQPIQDRMLITALGQFASDPDVELSEPVRAQLMRIIDALRPADITGWLVGDQPQISALLRWAPAEALALIRGYLNLDPPGAEESYAGPAYADAVLTAFPLLTSQDAAEIADALDAPGAYRNSVAITTLRLLPLTFPEQLDLLASTPHDEWPEGAHFLLKPPGDDEYLDVVRNLDLTGPLEPLKTRLNLLSKIREHRRTDAVLIDFDWSKLFTNEDAGLRTLSYDLADSIGGPPAAEALLQTGWTADDLEPIAAYEGSAVLGALPDEALHPLIPRLSGENCLRIMRERVALRDAAEARIWRWITDALEVARTSHSMGGTYCQYVSRDEAFREFVDRNTDRVHETLARVWADRRLRSNLLFDDGDSPGWPLVKALAPHQPDFVKGLWRDALRKERGFSFSSINTFPTEFPVGPGFDDVRLEMMKDLSTDDRLANVVRELQAKGHLEFLLGLIEDHLARPRPFDRAWAMAIAGFLTPTDETEELWLRRLADRPGPGWLGDVYDTSLKTFRSAAATRHWFRELGTDGEEADAWRAFRLMQLTVDDRYNVILREPPYMFEDRYDRVRWLNFLAPEEREARKRARKALSESWLRGPRYQDVINGR